MAITVDISNTIGQASAISANGGPVFAIEPTWPANACKDHERHGVMLGFGKVVSDGPVQGHEIGYRFESIKGEPAEGWQPCPHCVG